MAATPVILIFDIGKTNKKLLLFEEKYNIVYEESQQFAEIEDEDGFSCEDIEALTNWLKASFDAILSDNRFKIKSNARIYPEGGSTLGWGGLNEYALFQ